MSSKVVRKGGNNVANAEEMLGFQDAFSNASASRNASNAGLANGLVKPSAMLLTPAT
jgi:hypothetical protein